MAGLAGIVPLRDTIESTETVTLVEKMARVQSHRGRGEWRVVSQPGVSAPGSLRRFGSDTSPVGWTSGMAGSSSPSTGRSRIAMRSGHSWIKPERSFDRPAIAIWFSAPGKSGVSSASTISTAGLPLSSRTPRLRSFVFGPGPIRAPTISLHVQRRSTVLRVGDQGPPGCHRAARPRRAGAPGVVALWRRAAPSNSVPGNSNPWSRVPAQG